MTGCSDCIDGVCDMNCSPRTGRHPMELGIERAKVISEAFEALRWMAQQPQHHNLMNATLTDSGKRGFDIVAELDRLDIK